MKDTRSELLPPEAPLGQLERTLIDEFLREQGHAPHDLSKLPEPERAALLKEASLHASGKLAEVESRSQFVHGIHDPRTGS